MKVFYEYIKTAIQNMFDIDLDVFVSRKGRYVHFAFCSPLLSYPFYRALLNFISNKSRHREMLFEDYEIGNMIMYFFPEKNMSRTEETLEKLCNNIVDATNEIFTKKHYIVCISQAKSECLLDR